jgi:hypothetical protein
MVSIGQFAAGEIGNLMPSFTFWLYWSPRTKRFAHEFLALLNLANTPENFVKVVRTSIVVGDFLIRNPHVHYHDWPDFNGVTGVDRAVQIVATGSTGGP